MTVQQVDMNLVSLAPDMRSAKAGSSSRVLLYASGVMDKTSQKLVSLFRDKLNQPLHGSEIVVCCTFCESFLESYLFKLVNQEGYTGGTGSASNCL